MTTSPYADDIERIQRVCAQRGRIISAQQAQTAWGEESESMAAGWLGLPEDDGLLWDIVSAHLDCEHETDHIAFPEDVSRIVAIAARHGQILSPQQAQARWEAFSEQSAARWRILPHDDDAVWAAIS